MSVQIHAVLPLRGDPSDLEGFVPCFAVLEWEAGAGGSFWWNNSVAFSASVHVRQRFYKEIYQVVELYHTIIEIIINY